LPGIESGALEGPSGDVSASPFLQGLNVGYFSGGDIRALIRALGGDAFTNVLSTPSLVTLDNAEAEIVVGQNVPFITGQFTNNATTPDNPFQTIERQDVGIVLKVKPQINEGDAVTLEIEQEVSSIDRDTSGSDLITNKRSIMTTVLVDDGQTIVLGGLIEDDLQESVQKIPVLGDIPLLGRLFKTERSDLVKKNLMVFLRPRIIRDRAVAQAVSEKQYERLREEQKLQDRPDKVFMIPGEERPLLPSFDGLME
ncbi:MAG: type II secretion system protein GspD, partial [Gammaproteobacteria bacterium]|nr:type II secretion system protein GspD [Gammaproteobacteria bacterium]